LDTVILAVLAVGALFGALRGFLWQVARVVSVGVAVSAAIYLNDWAAKLLEETLLQGAHPRVSMGFAYLAVFVVFYLAFFCTAVLLERGIMAVRLEALNRLLGGALGAVKAALVLGAVFLGMASYPHTRTQEVLDRSLIAPTLADGMQLVIVVIPQEHKDWLCKGLESLRELAHIQPAGSPDGKRGGQH
jgi:uncharacterized membrane protein required for colicin V production